MEVPSAVLDNLLCENCEGYLSRGPVLLLHTGKSRCGRCVEPEEGATRNKPYEQLAKFVKFPCRYRANGCDQQVTFTESQVHEESCDFREYLCPIAESGKCEWTGVRGQLLEHCQQAHPSNVVENPVKLSHDIRTSSLGNYLLSAFQVLFLVQTKVCVTAKTIYHSVRLIGGDTAEVSRYEYELNIENGDSNILKRRAVAPSGCLALQVDSSIAMSINILLGVIGEFDGTTFTITVRKKEIDDEKREIRVQCVQCDRTTEPVFQNRHGWQCRACAPSKIPCGYRDQGCTYEDVEVKCRKHELFCKFGNRCIICRSEHYNNSPTEHYTQNHSRIIHNTGIKWTVGYKCKHWRIIMTDFGEALCYCYFYGSKMFLLIRTQLPSEELYKYRCVVEITNPQDGSTWKWTADRQYFYGWDWELNQQDVNIISFTNEIAQCDIKINFIKVETVAQLNL